MPSQHYCSTAAGRCVPGCLAKPGQTPGSEVDSTRLLCLSRNQTAPPPPALGSNLAQGSEHFARTVLDGSMLRRWNGSRWWR
eukprot:13743151-Alexandrium_andersonii.AAC.1